MLKYLNLICCRFLFRTPVAFVSSSVWFCLLLSGSTSHGHSFRHLCRTCGTVFPSCLGKIFPFFSWIRICFLTDSVFLKTLWEILFAPVFFLPALVLPCKFFRSPFSCESVCSTYTAATLMFPRVRIRRFSLCLPLPFLRKSEIILSDGKQLDPCRQPFGSVKICFGKIKCFRDLCCL